MRRERGIAALAGAAVGFVMMGLMVVILAGWGPESIRTVLIFAVAALGGGLGWFKGHEKGYQEGISERTLIVNYPNGKLTFSAWRVAGKGDYGQKCAERTCEESPGRPA